MDLFAKCRAFTMPNDYKEKGLYPYFHCLESRQDKEVIMEGKRKIMLGSNNYLGLTTCDEVEKAAIEGIKKYGTGCSGSRFMNGTLDLHLELENELKDFLNVEDVITFPTGFQTNLGIISSIVGRNDYVICDRENHASIYDGCKLSYGTMLRYHHNNMTELEKMLQKVPQDAGCLIVTDGVFSMKGDICNLPKIVQLAQKYNARVMVDDSHALGVIGQGGRGTANYFHLEDKVDIIMGTFSKSLASLGGFMAGSHLAVDYARHTSRPFIFSASMTPANTVSALTALKYLKAHPELPQKLQNKSNYARKSFRKYGIPIVDSTTPIIPVMTQTADYTLELARNLFNAGVYVNPVLPPGVPEHECLLRVSLMATVTKELIDEAAQIIASEIGKMERQTIMA